MMASCSARSSSTALPNKPKAGMLTTELDLRAFGARRRVLSRHRVFEIEGNPIGAAPQRAVISRSAARRSARRRHQTLRETVAMRQTRPGRSYCRRGPVISVTRRSCRTLLGG